MIRTRFAPSPTGHPHIGHLRTAIYAYLTAKKGNGIFFMRLEDTDQQRFIEGTADILIKCIKWIGIDIDEGFLGENITEKGVYGPYVQSLRKDLYKKYALELVEKDAAFFCFCPKEEHTKTDYTDSENTKTLHDFICRNRSKDEVEKKIKAGDPYVIKHKVPLNEYIIVDDIVRGKQKISTNILDDTVLLKSDGHATYHLAHLVDDYLMKTTHVIRSEEWLPSLPKHLLLFKQMGWQAPLYAHVSQIMIIDKETGNKRKFSKRKGDPNVLDFIKCGYLPESVFNFVVLLGWNPGKGEVKEIFNKEDLSSIFDLKDCNKAGALFDINKLDWMNGQYMRSYDTKKLWEYILWYWEEYGYKEELVIMKSKDIQWMLQILEQLKLKMKVIKDFYIQAKFFWDWQYPSLDILYNEKMKVDEMIINKVLPEIQKWIKQYDGEWNIEAIKTELNIIKERLNISNGQLLWPIRAVLSGEISSPGAYEMMVLLGRNESESRLIGKY